MMPYRTCDIKIVAPLSKEGAITTFDPQCFSMFCFHNQTFNQRPVFIKLILLFPTRKCRSDCLRQVLAYEWSKLCIPYNSKNISMSSLWFICLS